MTKQEPGARHTQDEGRGHPPPGGRQGRGDNPPENARELLPDPDLKYWPKSCVEGLEPEYLVFEFGTPDSKNLQKNPLSPC